uniref:Plexin D1 n=1 Tax=Salmo trutta TaxID=8032 RepID=A0A674BXF7_SALTR
LCPVGRGHWPQDVRAAPVVLIFGVLVLESSWNAQHSPWLASALQIQQAFASPNQTNNFVVDEVSRKVYLATVNMVYQLNRTLSVEVEKRTGPVEDNLLCHAPQLPQAPCEHPKSLTDNFNKLLELDREQGVLVVCGSVYQGFCELRKMENISQIAVEFPPQGEKTVFPSMLNIAANHPNASTVGLIFRSHGGNTRLLVGATYTGVGTTFFPKNHSKEDLRFENTPEIAIRSLNISDLSRLFTYDINPSEDNVFKIKQEVKQKNKLNFVHAFIQKTYSYIAINNDAKMGHKESQPNSILARICLDTENPRKSTSESRKLTESFIQMPLQCGYNGNIYNRLLSVHPAEIHSGTGEGLESYLFGVFTKSDRKSALCAFRFSDIEEEIRQGRRNCSNSPSSEVQVLDSVIQGSGAACVHKGNLVLQPEQLDCGAAHLQHPLALQRPLRATPLFESLGLSSVAVDDVHHHTVVFLGTSTGRLRKLTLLKNLTVANQWALKLPGGESVHHIMTFDPIDRNYLYLMTSHHLLRVKVATCSQYRTCSDCLGAGDAHCGWCTLESRCSIQRECAWGPLARSWIGMGEGPQQCPSMTLTPPEISLSTDIKDVGILINGSVPDLVGSRVECDYGLGVATAATVHLDYGPAQIQTCPLLPRERYPNIPPGRDHLTVPVAIKVNGTSVVSGSFVIYDCERTGAIHPKTAPLPPPLSLSVEVYNCEVGIGDCSQCWGRENLGHLCGWCDNSCRPRNDCQYMNSQCPDPEITKISPRSGPLEGGTLLTVQGRNMGHRAEVVEVSIGMFPCTIIPDQYTVSVELVCVTGQAVDPTSDFVRITVIQKAMGVSKEVFSYLVPKLLSMEPRKGSRSGGTRVTIKGEHLDTGSQIRVKVNGTQECTILTLTEDTIECTMPAALHTHTEAVSVCVEFEYIPCQRSELLTQYIYEKNPSISYIKPRQSYLSGGRTITVTGQGFDLVQSVTMEVLDIGQAACKVQPPSMITCPSPTSSQSQQATVEFFLNGVLYTGDSPVFYGPGQEEEEEPHGGHFLLEYVEDPQFFTANKEKLIKHHPGEPLTLIINKGPSNLELAPEEYSVMIGSYPCDISFHNDQLFHCSINGSLGSSEGELPVTVQVGNFQRIIAKVQLGGSELAIVVSIVVCCVLLLLCTVALVVYCTKSRRAERYWQKTLLQMEEMESQIREEIRKGFAELQTDMTDLTKELNSSQGIPFLEYKQFVTRTFFPKMCSDYERSLVQPVYENNALGPRALPETHPLLQDWQPSNTAKPNMEEGITLFSTLLNNKHFLVTFVHALEQQKDFAVRDRCSLASLLTIALHGKLEYYTSIMKDLLVDLIDASAAKNPKLMLRRTESVVEKMLTNWMSICMYRSTVNVTVGEPFFLLLCAIKQQINKGSIDAITGKARYTLNEEWLLRENIEAKPQNINVSFQGCGMDSLAVRVMNTDTICQVKDKILDAFYKNLPFSQWPQAEDVDLEWFASGSNSRILQDLDNTSVMEDGRKKLNTVTHYQIPEGASFAMSMKDKRDNTLGRGRSHTHTHTHTLSPCHTLLHLFENKKSHRQSHRKKVLPEIYLTRLLSTKGTLQKFLDDLFQAILSIPAERPPLAIKYFFDFLEEQADKRGITDPDTLHIWKTNSLPLRFWVNILKNPQFVFDIDKTDHMDACLSVIAQAFIDACSISDLQLGKDSPTNKLLYAKEIPEYKKRVQCYYKQIQEMAPLSEQEMNAHLAEESRKYRNEFNTNLALTEIYKYAKKYRNQVVSALESNPTAKRTQLHHKFEQVIALVEDNIYECSSEA